MTNNTNVTLDYYNQKASEFYNNTVKVNFSKIQQDFCKYIATGGKILDLGCGSGRDSKAFLDAGYDVTAIDGSSELCKIASQFIGKDVECTTFQDYQTDTIFDGIWACATLLHLNKEDIVKVMNKLSKNLKQDGCFYASFKYGDFSGIRNGRFFQNMTETSFKELLKNMPYYELISFAITSDVRSGREDEKWLNAFLRRK